MVGKCVSQLGETRNVSSLTKISSYWKFDHVNEKLLEDRSKRLFSAIKSLKFAIKEGVIGPIGSLIGEFDEIEIPSNDPVIPHKGLNMPEFI